MEELIKRGGSQVVLSGAFGFFGLSLSRLSSPSVVSRAAASHGISTCPQASARVWI
jgi:hypothetical protein